MTEFSVPDKTKTCTVTGHRDLSGGIDVEKTEEILLAAVNSGYDTFMVGMAIGFDFLCFKILEKIRCEKKIRIIACVPCKGQADKFSEAQKEEYLRMLSSADEVVILSDRYTPYCMHRRNAFMVDNSSLLIAYLRTEKGGTYNTVKYAGSKGVTIIRV